MTPSDQLSLWKQEQDTKLHDWRQQESQRNSRHRKAMFTLAASLAVGVFALGAYYLYLVHDGKLQASITQPISVDTRVNTTNSYTFTPTTTNAYTIQVNATIVLPNNLTLKMVNGT